MERYYEAYGKKGVGGTPEQILEKIVYRYLQENPEREYTFRAFHVDGFLQDESGRWVLDFDRKFPEAKEGDWACAVSQICVERDGIFRLSFTGHNPVWIYVDGKEVAATNCQDEVLNESRVFGWETTKGFHRIFIKCRKNALGFRCVLGCVSPKWGPVNFYTALERNKGHLGWNYCGLLSEMEAEKVFSQDFRGKKSAEYEAETVRWLPEERPWRFPRRNAAWAVSFCQCMEDSEVSLCFRVPGHAFQVYVDGVEILSGGRESGLGNAGMEAGRSQFLKKGLHRIAVRIENTTEDTVVEGRAQRKREAGKPAEGKTEGVRLCLPDWIQGVSGDWLYLDSDDERVKYGFDGSILYDGQLCGTGWSKGLEGKTCFQSGENAYLRPVQEEPLFGKSNYPIGVVLYGLLTAGKYLKSREITDYAHRHLLQCCKMQEYVHWDSLRYGYACMNQQLVSLSALDDCGAFFAAVLEDCLEYNREEALLPAVEEAADYILKKQERLENGMFYRKMEGRQAQYTVWADDLYMSIPFLIRYAELKNRPEVLEDAINQVLHFKELLYIPEKKLMSHVYQLKLGLATKIPWGRGNGWVLFTLSELLKVLPKEQSGYQEIKGFYLELCEGFLQVIDEDGMLHQVLDEPDSYGEASCSAMCASAFARGVKLGILPQEPYGAAAKRIVEALKQFCIDEEGNVYGVCMGSSYSFRREYYMHELGWRINDTHGTGIVLLALVETAGL